MRAHKLQCMLLLLLAIFLLLPGGGVARAAVQKGTVIRVGFPVQAGISYLDEAGNYTGYLVDYLDQLSLYTGWEYEYVQAEGDLNTQLTTLLEMLAVGEIDMMGTMNRSETLEEFYLYPSYSYGTTYTTLAVREDSQTWLEEDFANWDGIVVASYPGFANRMALLEKYAAVNGFTFQVRQYDTLEEVLAAVMNGEADATLQVDISLSDGLRSIARFSPTPYYFALAPGNEELLQTLNSAMNSLSRAYPHLQTELYDRYFTFSDHFFLSQTDAALIQSLGTVRVLFFDGSAPFQTEKNGVPTGVAADYFQQFAQQTGLQYEPVIASSYDEAISLIQQRQVDLIACASTASELLSLDGLRISLPYFSSNSVVVCTSTDAARNHGQVQDFRLNTELYLKDLSAGRRDCVRMDAYSVNYYMSKKSLGEDLYVDWANVQQLSYAVAMTDHMPDGLLPILNHYASALSEEDRQTLLYQSFSESTDFSLGETLYAYRVQLLVTAVVLALVACIILLLRRGRRVHRKMADSESKVRHLSRYDGLTGAYNGTYFRKLVEYICQEKIPVVMVALNVRNFKHINETYGITTADRLLCCIKDCLDQATRGREFFCRQAADTFYLVLHEDTPEAISARIQALGASIQAAADALLEGYPVALYFGGVFTASSPEPHSIANHSYMMSALAQAKKQNMQGLCLYDKALHEQEQLRNYVESRMQAALDQEEFLLYLQPKIDLRNGRLKGAEALVRWQPADRAMLYPNQFIPQFEENGFCVQLDLYMVELVCRQLRAWQDAGLPPVPISVNQTKLLFYSPGYVEKLLGLTRKYDVSPAYITLEILEGLALENVEKLNHSIDSLNAVGFQISMDDFGSGYSSLNTLGKIKIDELKLDRLFLMDVAKDAEGKQRKVLAAIVALAKQLNIRTVVEGVETREHEQMVTALACDCAQGYYYSKPISTARFLQEFLLPDFQKS